MNTLPTRLALLALCALACATARAQDKPGTTAAPFLRPGTDARGAAMGGAQTATAGGAAALFWNPAGIAQPAARAGSGDAVFSNSDWFLDSRHSFAGATFATGLGTFGLSFTQLDYGDEPVTTIDNPDGTGETFTASDLSIAVSYGRALTDQFQVGASVKVVRQQLFNESAQGAAVDLGVQYQTGLRGITIGAAMTNFGTDMRLSGRDLLIRADIDPTIEGNNGDLAGALEVDDWPLPLSFRVGVGADVVRLDNQSLRVVAEGSAPSDNSQSASFGAEYAFADLVYVRGGYREAFTGVADDGGWTLGFGVAYDVSPGLGLRVDYVRQEYALETPQMFSLGVAF